MMRGPNLLRILPGVLFALPAFAVAACGAEASAPEPGAAEPGTAEAQFGAPPSTLAPTDDGGLPPPSSAVVPSAPAEPTSAPAPSAASGTPDLGALPSEMSALTWPTQPHATREVTVRTAAELEAAAATPGTRILVEGGDGGDVHIAGSDIEIVASPGASLGQLTIAQRAARVRVEGGHWTAVRVEIPADFSAGASYQPELMAQDLWFEGMTVESGGESAFEIRGTRIALVGNDITAGRYSVWCGDTGDFQTEDLILYDNVFRSAGPEATVRLVSVLRSATVSNVLTNTYKHNYRIHGVSDLNFASDNLLVGTGVMLGTMDGDVLGRVWFDDNILHHDAPDLFNPSPTAIEALSASRNVAYCDGHAAFYGGEVPSGWTMAENQIAPYQPPPAF